jgi:VWFA-related protein
MRAGLQLRAAAERALERFATPMEGRRLMRTPRRLACISILLMCPGPVGAGPALGARKQIPSSNSGFSVTSRLVLVDVVVRSGEQPVCGLAQKNFEVQENGRAQAIQSFEAHCAGAVPREVRMPELPPQTYSNLPVMGATSSVNVLLLDGLNTRAKDEMRARAEMLKSLRTLPPGRRIAIFTLGSHLRMLAGFTTDTSVLIKALAGLKALQTSTMLPPAEEKMDEEELVDSLPVDMQEVTREFLNSADNQQTGNRIEETLRALQMLGRYLQGIPGRKNLLWFSGTFPLATFQSVLLQGGFHGERTQDDYQRVVRQTASLLAGARVAVYPVDVRGVISQPIYDMSQMRNIAVQETIDDERQEGLKEIAERGTLQMVAQETGGRAIYLSNDLAKDMTGALQDGANYYTIAYAPADTKFNGVWRKIKVRVDVKPAKGRYQLFYRDGYFAMPGGTDGTQQTFAAAMRMGVPDSSQILFDVHVAAESGSVPTGPVAGGNAKLGNRVARYRLDYAAAMNDLDLTVATGGKHTGELAVYATAYNRDGLVVNWVSDAFRYALDPEQWQRATTKGVQIHQEMDLPVGDYQLRMGLFDPLSGHIGTLQLPVHVSARAAAKAH